MILHTVNKSPYSSQCLADCLRRVSPGDRVILIEDGVYGINCARSNILTALDNAMATLIETLIKELAASNVRFYALRPDIEARGLQTIDTDARFSLVGDADFVDLVVEADKVLSWY